MHVSYKRWSKAGHERHVVNFDRCVCPVQVKYLPSKPLSQVSEECLVKADRFFIANCSCQTCLCCPSLGITSHNDEGGIRHVSSLLLNSAMWCPTCNKQP